MKSQKSGLDESDLNRIIAPEIKNDQFYKIIKRLAANETLKTVLEIGSSAGGGSTEAFVAGLSQNPGSPKLFCIEVSKPRFKKLQETYKPYPFVHCYNLSSVTIDQFPTPEAVTAFYNEVSSGLRKFPLPSVLDWLRQDIQYVREIGRRSWRHCEDQSRSQHRNLRYGADRWIGVHGRGGIRTDQRR